METGYVVTPCRSTTASGCGAVRAGPEEMGTLPNQGMGDQPKDQDKTYLEEDNKCAALRIEEDKAALGRRDFWLALAVFILIGLNSLMAWNVMLNLAPYMAASYFDGQDCGNTFLACFQGACVTVQVAFIYFQCKPSALTFYTAAIVNVGAFLAVTPAAAYCSKTVALVLVHLICLLWGAASGALQGAGFAYAGMLPVNFAVFVSAGQGTAGFAAFALNTLLGFVFFDLNTYTGLTRQSWVLYAICSILSALLAVGILSLTSRPWARQPFQNAEKEKLAAESLPQFVVRVVSNHDEDKLVGQTTHLSDENETQRAPNTLSTDFSRATATTKGQEGSTARWGELTAAINSKDTLVTLLGSETSAEVSNEQAKNSPHQTTSSNASENSSPAERRDLAEVNNADKMAAQDFPAGIRPSGAVRADAAEQQADGLCTGSTLPKRDLCAIAIVMWQPLLALVVTFFVTLNLFPRIGPVGWKYNQEVPNHFVILFGLFAVADTAGRSTPSLQLVSPRWLGWTLVPERTFVWLTFARILFYIPFFLSYKLEDRVVLNDFWWLSCLMLVFAYTHGWFTSLGFIYAVDKVRESEKGIAGPLAVVALSLGILVGLYVALAY